MIHFYEGHSKNINIGAWNVVSFYQTFKLQFPSVKCPGDMLTESDGDYGCLTLTFTVDNGATFVLMSLLKTFGWLQQLTYIMLEPTAYSQLATVGMSQQYRRPSS